MTPEQLLQEVVKALADHPEQVRFKSFETDNLSVHEVHVAEDDVGKILGKRGANVDALRTIFIGIYAKLGKKLHLLVLGTEKEPDKR